MKGSTNKLAEKRRVNIKMKGTEYIPGGTLPIKKSSITCSNNDFNETNFR